VGAWGSFCPFVSDGDKHLLLCSQTVHVGEVSV
jgi:hypothetical protein